MFDQPINVSTKKQILANFNKRPENIHGKEIRFIIMDSGFKEGIDLFDVNMYIFSNHRLIVLIKNKLLVVHTNMWSKGLEFHPTKVFITCFCL